MKKSTHTLSTLILASLLAGTFSASALATSASDFQDTEYYASEGLDVINAANAYALGYTGKGSYVCISDYPINFLSQEFNTKTDSSMLNKASWLGKPQGIYDWSYLKHGTYVAGIAAASRNGVGMQGVAYDAEISGICNGVIYTPGSFPLGTDIFGPALSNTAIKVINCSWDPGDSQNSYYPDSIGYDATKDFIVNDECQYTQQVLNAAQADKLLVFAGGNSGHPTSQISSLIGHFLPGVANNLLIVTSLNNTAVVKNADGSLSSSDVLSTFSDRAKYAEDFTLAAPGEDVRSAEANFAATGTIDGEQAGTSMSAPFVTGAAAVVQQAFPYLSAKQLGDVLLSTANTNVNCTAQVQLSKQVDEDNGNTISQINRFHMNNGTRQTLTNQKNTSNSSLPTNDYYNVPMQELIGQGVLDVGAAVLGPGALNVRRLTTADISSDYTIAGTSGPQALYTVNTGGYNSNWSNNIKEIKADHIAADSSEEDLRERWQYYDTNWLSYTGTDRDTAKTSTAAYVTAFNQNIDDSGLRNLHAGLYKTGEGILRLSGTNTYQGSSIAAGGTLVIDGSVAGDAYSLSGGTLAGTGTIKGNVYNKGTLLPGTYALSSVFDTDPAYSPGTLTINGNLTSTGTLQIAIKGLQNSKVEVGGTADLKNSTESLTKDSDVPVLNHAYNFLTAQSVVADNLNKPLSPYISLMTTSDGTHAYIMLQNTTPLGNLPGMSPSENAVGTALNNIALNRIATDPTTAAAKTMNSLLYQDEASSRTTIKQITNDTRAQLITANALTAMTADAAYDRLDTALYDGNVNVNVPMASFDGVPMSMKVSTPMTLDTTNNLWFKLLRGIESYGSTDGGYDLDNKSFGGVIGYDKAVNGTTRVGGLFSYAKTDYTTDVMNGDSHDWRIGAYASNDTGTWKTQGLVSYGNNKYGFDRYVLGDTVCSDYTAKVFDINAKVKYLPQFNRAKSWQVAPYAGLAYTHTSQDAYTEDGSSIFAQSMDSTSNNSYRAEAGVEWKHDMNKENSFGGSIGYKRVLSGVNPELNGTFVGDTNRFTLSGDNDRNYVTYSVNVKSNAGNNWTVQGEIRGEKSAHNHSEVYSLMAKYSY